EAVAVALVEADPGRAAGVAAGLRARVDRVRRLACERGSAHDEHGEEARGEDPGPHPGSIGIASVGSPAPSRAWPRRTLRHDALPRPPRPRARRADGGPQRAPREPAARRAALRPVP